MSLDEKLIIGKKIRLFRIKNKLTQSELAEKVGLCEKHIGQIERGAYLPKLNNFIKIINVLNIDLSEFGLNMHESNPNKKIKEILNIIYKASDKELELYYNIITAAAKTFSM